MAVAIICRTRFRPASTSSMSGAGSRKTPASIVVVAASTLDESIGVSPTGPLGSGVAPRASSSSTTSAFPMKAAACIAVRPP